MFASYAAILFNAIATIASLLFVDRLGGIDFNGSRKNNIPKGKMGRNDSSLDLLRRFGAGANLKLLFIQCEPSVSYFALD